MDLRASAHSAETDSGPSIERIFFGVALVKRLWLHIPQTNGRQTPDHPEPVEGRVIHTRTHDGYDAWGKGFDRLSPDGFRDSL
jgi:uncharacterized damage-inducible protein DinB